MNQKLKILIIGILMCTISYGLMIILDYFVFVKLGDWTMPLAHKYLVFNLTSIDRNLVRWFPIILALIQISIKIDEIKIYFKNVLWTFILVITMLFLGLIIALLTWSSKGAENPLLPEFLKYQPFEYYWTIFIVIGMMISFLFLYLSKKKVMSKVQKTMDNN